MTSGPSVPRVLIADPDDTSRHLVSECVRKIRSDIQILEFPDEKGILSWLLANRGTPSSIVFSELKWNADGRVIDGMKLMRAIEGLSELARPAHLFLCSDLLETDTQDQARPWLTFLSKPFDPLSLVSRLQPLVAANPGSAPPVNAEVFNAFSAGVTRVFTRMLNSDIGRDRFKLRQDEPLRGAIAGILPLRCRAFEGRMVLVMDEACFLSISRRLIPDGAESQISSRNQDLIMELSNQIFGYAKMILNESGFGFEMSLPSVARGADACFAPVPKGRIHVATQFMSEFGEFTLEIQIQKLLA